MLKMLIMLGGLMTVAGLPAQSIIDPSGTPGTGEGFRCLILQNQNVAAATDLAGPGISNRHRFVASREALLKPVILATGFAGAAA